MKKLLILLCTLTILPLACKETALGTPDVQKDVTVEAKADVAATEVKADIKATDVVAPADTKADVVAPKDVAPVDVPVLDVPAKDLPKEVVPVGDTKVLTDVTPVDVPVLPPFDVKQDSAALPK